MTQSTSWLDEDRIPRHEWLPFYNVREVAGNYLLTNRIGDWDILSHSDFSELNSNFVPSQLIRRLAENRLVITDTTATELLTAWRDYNHNVDDDGPRLHIVHLTQRCNLGCSYCHSAAIPVEASGRDMQPEVADQVANFIAQTPSNTVSLNFQGGEPTLMPELIDRIMNRVSAKSVRKRVRGSITTNGTNLTPGVVEILRKHAIGVTISLDGPKQSHDTIRVHRNGKGSYGDVLAGRELLANDPTIDFSGSILVLSRKTADQVTEVIDEYVRLGQRSLHLKGITRLGFGKSNWDDLGLSFEEYWTAYERGLEHILNLQARGIEISELQLIFAIDYVVSRQKPDFVDFRNPCGLVFGVLNYDIDGKIYACHEGKRKKDFLIGTATDDPKHILNSTRAKDIAANSVLDRHAECRACTYLAYCAPCPASAHQTTGSAQIVPYEDFHCRFTLRLFDWVFSKIVSEPDRILRMWRKAAVKTLLRPMT